jgi:hypothetical protein
MEAGPEAGLDDIMPHAIIALASLPPRLCATRLSWAWGYAAGCAVGESVRGRLAAHPLAMPPDRIRTWPPARIAGLFTEDGRWIVEVAMTTLSRLSSSLAAVICLFAVIALLDPMVVGVLAATGAAALLVLRQAEHRLRALIRWRRRGSRRLPPGWANSRKGLLFSAISAGSWRRLTICGRP